MARREQVHTPRTSISHPRLNKKSKKLQEKYKKSKEAAKKYYKPVVVGAFSAEMLRRVLKIH